MAKLSVIIVNYNVEFFLEQCLYSVRKASERIDVEIIVVDNASVDASVQIVQQKFPEVIVIENKVNLGFSCANNQGIRIAKGKYILLLNPDTVVEEDTFLKVIQFMDEHPNAGGLGVKMLDGKGRFLPESKRGLPTPKVSFFKVFGLSKLFPKSQLFGKYHLGYLDENSIHSVDVLSGAFMLLRHEVLDKTGLLDENFFMYGEDIDLSYRITQQGYKNYYFPGTRIIHYKGESTKKGSVNYVFMFYNAMIIFARKHFSQNNAFVISTLIKIAIYLRAFLAILKRITVYLALPIIDATLIFAGLFIIKSYYAKHFQFALHNGNYPPTLLLIAFCCYVFIWIFTIWIQGGYDKPIRLGKIALGIFFGSAIIIMIYSLLPELYRFSRAIIILGTLWALIGVIGIRVVLHSLKIKNFKLDINNALRIVIVGSEDECTRVNNLLKLTSLKTSFVGFYSYTSSINSVNAEPELKNQINEYIKIYKIDEIVFCAKDISAQSIITMMLDLGNTNVDFKIAPPESLSVIGSNSIDTSGDLYTIDVNSITKAENRRIKRLFDIATAIFLLLFCIPIVLFQKHSKVYFSNIFKVLLGKMSLIGYSAQTSIKIAPKGILIPSVILGKSLQLEVASKIDLMYAKDYKLSNDIKIFVQGWRNIGD